MILDLRSVDDAKARLDQLEPGSPPYLLQAGALAYHADDFPSCYDHLLGALERAPQVAWNIIVREASHVFEQTLHRTGRTAETVAHLDRLFADHPTMTTISIHDVLDNRDALELRASRMGRNLPSAAVITQTKSASVSVGAILASGFGMPTVTYSAITEAVVPSWAWDFTRGGACYVTHLRPTPDAVEQIEVAGISPIFVHVRDPRQAFLSWLHYAPSLWGTQAAATLAAQFDDMFAWYEDAVDWIAGWADAGPRLGIHFSTFEEFVADRDGFVDRMVAAYGGHRRHFDRAAATAQYDGIDYHRRRGETDEWRRVLTADQVDRLNAALPPQIADRFGWPLD